MLSENKLKGIVRSIRKEMIPGTFEIFPVGDEFSWQYDAPCACSERRFSVCTFTKDEIEYIVRGVSGLPKQTSNPG